MGTMKTTKEEYDDALSEVNDAIEFILPYFIGCMEELKMDQKTALKTAIRVYVKEQRGFIEPYQFNVNKYKEDESDSQ